MSRERAESVEAKEEKDGKIKVLLQLTNLLERSKVTSASKKHTCLISIKNYDNNSDYSDDVNEGWYKNS